MPLSVPSHLVLCLAALLTAVAVAQPGRADDAPGTEAPETTGSSGMPNTTGGTDARINQRPGQRPAAPGTVTGRQPLTPASKLFPKEQRSFKRCNEEALRRKLRGADRRHFVARCRLGYGYRIFRRRNAPPA